MDAKIILFVQIAILLYTSFLKKKIAPGSCCVLGAILIIKCELVLICACLYLFCHLFWMWRPSC